MQNGIFFRYCMTSTGKQLVAEFLQLYNFIFNGQSDTEEKMV